MPYSSVTELPDAVRERYSERCQEVFRKAFNNALDTGTSEESAFKVGHTAAGMCKDAGKAALKAEPLDKEGMDAWFAGEVPRRLLAIPFTGPIGGRDMDGEFFSPRTDIKADWFPERPALWHHGVDPTGTMGSTVIGKAVNPTLEDDGWWVDFWFKAGERRVQSIRKLAEKGAELFGSSSAIPHLVKKAATGEILVWPYWEQTLSTSPQNTHSVLRSAKAVMEDYDTAEISVLPALRDVLTELETLRDLHTDLDSGEVVAKAGRELSGANLAELDEWLEMLTTVSKRASALRERVRTKYEQQSRGD